ncbi:MULTISPECIES: c-type cytochrome [Burkholderia]|jgi:cytochrome c551/c552|uniref:Cytochrome C n=1 Tax=Burkholderia cenocepacia TaxID=95486 RepID=A0A1V2VS34_9BURK|nr:MULTISPECIES: c-type cytochrome [Burkholderia]AIO44563.1 cytochrome c family protein [Burkholderia cepacia]KGC00647.1 cytochrome c family protein [Burkholderia cepacia]MBG0873272.1 cytochrome C [Burkholderia sp. 9777_1386]MBR8285361.1 cytochrome C [Burkholderia cenocepacia]MBR8501776.1 cytochrome C [Burkholderia cenocepacia]
MSIMRCAALCAIALTAGTAAAQTTVPEPTELVNAQHCMFCHTPDMTFLGPSFHEIAERYRDDPHAAAELERKLRVGGRVHWGNTPMPSAIDRGGPLSADDAHLLVQWVLSQ